MGPRQLSFVFADSPSGGGKDERSDVSEQRSFLLHKAKRKTTSGSNASAADTRRLLEGSMGEIEPPRDAKGLSSVMVRRSVGLAQSDVERSSSTAGLGPA